MQCLRGAIAHKMDHSYDIILNFNEEGSLLTETQQHTHNAGNAVIKGNGAQLEQKAIK